MRNQETVDLLKAMIKMAHLAGIYDDRVKAMEERLKVELDKCDGTIDGKLCHLCEED